MLRYTKLKLYIQDLNEHPENVDLSKQAVRLHH